MSGAEPLAAGNSVVGYYGVGVMLGCEVEGQPAPQVAGVELGGL